MCQARNKDRLTSSIGKKKTWNWICVRKRPIRWSSTTQHHSDGREDLHDDVCAVYIRCDREPKEIENENDIMQKYVRIYDHTLLRLHESCSQGKIYHALHRTGSKQEKDEPKIYSAAVHIHSRQPSPAPKVDDLSFAMNCSLAMLKQLFVI